MKNINRPEYDVNQIASFITENVDDFVGDPRQDGPANQPQPGAPEQIKQVGRGLGQYSGSFQYPFEEFEKDGELFSGTLVVDTSAEQEYDEDGGASYAVSAEGFKGINNFQRQDPNTGEYIDIDTSTPEGQDIMTKVGMSIIHEEPEHDSTENAFGIALRDHEMSNDRSPNDYMD